MIECKICGKIFQSKKGLSLHLFYKHRKKTKKDLKFECNICNKRFISMRHLGRHLQNHNTTSKKYYITYKLDGKVPKCEFCGKDRRFFSLRNGFRKTCGDRHCQTLYTKKYYKISDKTREKLRQNRFRILKEKLCEDGWTRRSKGKMSYLEEWFFDKVICEYELHRKYDIVNEYAFYPYFIDFAFLNIKLAVELDGKQHFQYESVKKRDAKKNKLLTYNGWIVYRIQYKEQTEEKIQEFLHVLENIDKYEPKVFKEDRVYKNKELKVKKKKLSKEERLKRLREKNRQKYLKQIELIENSDIDFSVYGWQPKVIELTNLNPNTLIRWMRKYMLDFYNENCQKNADNLNSKDKIL